MGGVEKFSGGERGGEKLSGRLRNFWEGFEIFREGLKFF